MGQYKIDYILYSVKIGILYITILTMLNLDCLKRHRDLSASIFEHNSYAVFTNRKDNL